MNKLTYTQQLQIHLELITTNLFEPSINIINPHKSVFLNKNISEKSFFHKTWSYMKPNEEYLMCKSCGTPNHKINN